MLGVFHLALEKYRLVNGVGYSPVKVEAPDNISRRVLVVDDEALVCDSIRRVLEKGKHQVTTAGSAAEALSLFKPGLFDLVVLDYELPGMKGDKLAATMKAQAPQQPILMLTAYGEALRHSGSFPLPVDLVMAKPFGALELLNHVQQLAANK